MIHIYSQPEEGMRLKSYCATVKGAAAVLRIEIEVDDPKRLGWLLEELRQHKQAEIAAARAKRSPKRLALPKPEGIA